MKGNEMKQGQEQRQNKPSLRFAAVSLVLAKAKMGGSISRAIAETIETMVTTGEKISRSALYRWLRKYRKDGWRGLQQPELPRQGTALPEIFLRFMLAEKKLDPKASIPEVIRRAKQQEIIGREQKLSRSTVYRHARKMNLPLFRQSSEKKQHQTSICLSSQDADGAL